MILKQFQLGDDKKKRRNSMDFGAMIMEKINVREEEMKQQGIIS